MRSLGLSSSLGLVLLVGSSEAAPLASLREDVDGDGTPELIELTSDGVVRIGTASVKLGAPITEGKLAIARQPGNIQLIVDIGPAAKREGVILDRARGWHVVTRVPLGGVGLDREYGIELDATPAGIYRYQTRWDVRRCDGKPAYLFAEKLEGATFRKLDKIPTHVSNATTIPARLDSTPAPAPLIFQAKAASHQPATLDAGGLALPRELDDGRTDTGWHEELASSGEGQFFTFKPRVDLAQANQLRVVPGNPISQAAMRTANRPRVMAIVSTQGAWRFELPDAANDPLGAAYVVDLPQPLTECVTVVLETAYGRPGGATAIAELGIYAKDERTGGGEALLARVLADGTSNTTNVSAALARRGGAGAAAIDVELAKTSDAATRRRLVGALVKIQDPAAASSLVRAAVEGWVRDQDLLDVITALAANNQVIPLRDLAAKGGVPIEIRVAAASKLPTGGTGLTALVELAGRGPRDLRHAVIDRLASAKVELLVQAAGTRAEAAAAGDLWRAATRGARGNSADRAVVVSAMLAALPTVTDYERRYRLIDGLATHGDAAALAELTALLNALPAGGESAALRQVAIRGVASAPRTEAVSVVTALARDTDPGVRLAALSALASAESDAAGAWHGADGPDAIDRVIVNGLADSWPEVRRRAATALGTRCQRTGPARALLNTVAKDPDLDVRGDSLTALVQCNASGVATLLARTWDDAKLPVELRVRAIGLVNALGDKALAATLVGKFTRWRGLALESKDAMLLAQAAAAAIGQLGPPGAAQALIAALDDSAFPEIVSSAALALGALGKACPPAAKLKLTSLARSTEQSAIAAKRAAAQCGGATRPGPARP